MSNGVIFSAGTKAQNIASAQALDALVLAQAFAAQMADPSDTTAYADPMPHPDADAHTAPARLQTLAHLGSSRFGQTQAHAMHSSRISGIR